MDAILLDIRDDRRQQLDQRHADKIEVLSLSHGVGDADDGQPEREPSAPWAGQTIQDLTVHQVRRSRPPSPADSSVQRGTNLKTVTITVGRNDAGAILPYLV